MASLNLKTNMTGNDIHYIGDCLLSDPNWLANLKSLLGSGTERSEAPQGRPPSAMGSPSAAPTEPESVKSQTATEAKPMSNGKAEGEASDDSSVVRLPVSDSAGTDAPAPVRRTRHHMCVDIAGVLRWPDKMLSNLFTDEGEKRSGKVVRDWLKLQLAQGKRVLPMGERCEGFSDIDGCPGHEITEAPETETPRPADAPQRSGGERRKANEKS